MNKKFITKICTCGCNKEYISHINIPKPSKYEIIEYKSINKEPLVIKRLLDGQEFRLGDTIKRISPLGKSYGKVILYKIQVEKNGFMQLHCYTINHNGIVVIQNEYYGNAEYSNYFNYIKNITSKK